MSLDVAVIGAGLFGRVIAQELSSRGREVSVFDARFTGAGSLPAACLIKPSWLGGMSKQEVRDSLDLLDRHYGLRTLKFRAGLEPVTKTVDVHWVDPRAILRGPLYQYEVLSIEDRSTLTLAPPDGGPCEVWKARDIIVAAGVWSSKLVPVPGLRGLAGVAFTWETPECFHMQPFIKPWAPFKQIIAFKRAENELWCGDGSTILQNNWTSDHTLRSRLRCTKALGLPSNLQGRELWGVRPYVRDAKPAFLQKINGVWVATGGAKNGTAAAAWCARRLALELA